MKLSQRLAIFFWASFFAMIVAETSFPRPWMNSSEYFFLTALFLSIVALGWVLADAKENKLEVPLLLRICIVVAAFLAVPYYRFRYFGMKAGFIFLGIVSVCFAALLLMPSALKYLSLA
jgi:1,4-dihydroxy-2-naphthoate octaprenyltransferase